MSTRSPRVSTQKPRWIPDEEVSACMICCKNFSFQRRKHHCRSCGIVICAKCSENRVKTAGNNSRVVRVCDGCYIRLTPSGTSSDKLGSIQPITQVDNPIERPHVQPAVPPLQTYNNPRVKSPSPAPVPGAAAINQHQHPTSPPPHHSQLTYPHDSYHTSSHNAHHHQSAYERYAVPQQPSYQSSSYQDEYVSSEASYHRPYTREGDEYLVKPEGSKKCCIIQ